MRSRIAVLSLVAALSLAGCGWPDLRSGGRRIERKRPPPRRRAGVCSPSASAPFPKPASPSPRENSSYWYRSVTGNRIRNLDSLWDKTDPHSAEDAPKGTFET
jgi:hypothetical protein